MTKNSPASLFGKSDLYSEYTMAHAFGTIMLLSDAGCFTTVRGQDTPPAVRVYSIRHDIYSGAFYCTLCVLVPHNATVHGP